MMLRWLIGVLLLLNLALLAWNLGGLARWGLSPEPDRNPISQRAPAHPDTFSVEVPR